MIPLWLGRRLAEVRGSAPNTIATCQQDKPAARHCVERIYAPYSSVKARRVQLTKRDQATDREGGLTDSQQTHALRITLGCVNEKASIELVHELVRVQSVVLILILNTIPRGLASASGTSRGAGVRW